MPSTHRPSQSPTPSLKKAQTSPQQTSLSPHQPEAQESTTHPDPTAESCPLFNPLFTLLTSHPSPTTHHPTVHYLFSDDDPSLLTSAALSTLETPSPLSPSISTPNSPHPGATPPSKEHILLIDLDPTGTKVVNAQSISPEWAITAAEIGNAPTWGEEQEEGLMLSIEGVEAAKGGGVAGEIDKGTGAMANVYELEGLVERFQKGMEGLRRVVEAGERWEGKEEDAGET